MPCNKQLLWVDDEWPRQGGRRRLLEELVGKDNLTLVQTAEAAERALQGEQQFDCVLIDIMLPRNDEDLHLELVHLDAGIAILKLIRDGAYSAVSKDVPVVALTARGNNEAIKQIEQLLTGNHDHLLPKPARSDDVRRAVKKALEER